MTECFAPGPWTEYGVEPGSLAEGGFYAGLRPDQVSEDQLLDVHRFEPCVLADHGVKAALVLVALGRVA